jgi:signal transduction histidine kinase
MSQPLEYSDQKSESYNFFNGLSQGVLVFDATFKARFINHALSAFLEKNQIHQESEKSIISLCSHFLSFKDIMRLFDSEYEEGYVVPSQAMPVQGIDRISFHRVSKDQRLLSFVFNDSEASIGDGVPFDDVFDDSFYLELELTQKGRFRIVRKGRVHQTEKRLLSEDLYLVNIIHPDDYFKLLPKLRIAYKTYSNFSMELRVTNHSKKYAEWYKVKFFLKENRLVRAVFENINSEKIQTLIRARLIEETIRDERNRIAMDLHDGVSQSLVALKLMMSGDKQVLDRSEIIKCQTILDTGLLELKYIVRNLSTVDFSLGFLIGIKNFVDNLNHYSENVHYVFVNQCKTEKLLDLNTCNILLRMIQEFISNSQKYSECTVVAIEISGGKQSMTIAMKDNGLGFDMDSVKRGFGVDNLRKRATILNAEFDFHSEAGCGTRMKIVV